MISDLSVQRVLGRPAHLGPYPVSVPVWPLRKPRRLGAAREDGLALGASRRAQVAGGHLVELCSRAHRTVDHVDDERRLAERVTDLGVLCFDRATFMVGKLVFGRLTVRVTADPGRAEGMFAEDESHWVQIADHDKGCACMRSSRRQALVPGARSSVIRTHLALVSRRMVACP